MSLKRIFFLILLLTFFFNGFCQTLNERKWQIQVSSDYIINPINELFNVEEGALGYFDLKIKNNYAYRVGLDVSRNISNKDKISIGFYYLNTTVTFNYDLNVRGTNLETFNGPIRKQSIEYEMWQSNVFRISHLRKNSNKFEFSIGTDFIVYYFKRGSNLGLYTQGSESGTLIDPSQEQSSGSYSFHFFEYYKIQETKGAFFVVPNVGVIYHFNNRVSLESNLFVKFWSNRDLFLLQINGRNSFDDLYQSELLNLTTVTNKMIAPTIGFNFRLF